MGEYASIDYELLKKQRAEGWTMDRLAQWHGVSRWTIAEWLRRGAHTPTKRRYTGCCNHKDENPQNNHVDNLEWCTHKFMLFLGRNRLASLYRYAVL